MLQAQGLTREQFWAWSSCRSQDRQEVPLRLTKKGRPFSYRLPIAAQHFLLSSTNTRRGDRSSFPQLDSSSPIGSVTWSLPWSRKPSHPANSSAVVTRESGQDMLQTGRALGPGTSMILNNYRTIRMLNSQSSRQLTFHFSMRSRTSSRRMRLTSSTWSLQAAR